MSEQDALKLVERVGGSLTRDAKAPDQPIVEVRLALTAATDSDFRCLSDLRHVRWLGMRYADVSDRALEQLRGWKSLEYLDCGFTRVSGHGLKYLHPECPLKVLDFCGDVFDPLALRLLEGRQTLESLVLMFTRVSDDDVRPCAALSNLERLYLNNTDLTDNALEIIGQIRSLRYLGLNETRITDSGMRHLAGLHQLQELHMAMCPHVTEDGLEQLAVIPALTKIVVYGSGVTRVGVRKARRAFPTEARKRLTIITY